MLIRTSPCGWRHVAHIYGAKVEDDGVALVQQISICCRHAAGIAGTERFPTESNISEIREMIIFRPIQNDEFSVTL
jgi:hypothetical protein